MENHIVPVKVYLRVFAALMLLLVATVICAKLDFVNHGFAIGTSLAFAIALIKGVLIVMYFMHVRYSPRYIWIAAAAGFFWLIILFALTLCDYMSRSRFEGAFGY